MLTLSFKVVFRTEDQRDAPEPRDPDQGKNDPREGRSDAAGEPGNEIEGEEPDASPADAGDEGV